MAPWPWQAINNKINIVKISTFLCLGRHFFKPELQDFYFIPAKEGLERARPKAKPLGEKGFRMP